MRRRAPRVAALAQMAAAIVPGARATSVRRLPGGLSASMHTFTLVSPDGVRQRLVLRRYVPENGHDGHEQASRAWQTLTALAQLQIAAPRPVWHDLDGALFGLPALVMTRVAGRSTLVPTDRAAWVRGLAQALAGLHRASLTGVDLSFLEGAEPHLARQFRWAFHHTSTDRHPDCAAIREALTRWQPRVRKLVPVLTHGDYWAGNTLWLRGRLNAIVDWDSAAIAYPGLDVGYARMDLNNLDGGEWADLFLAEYEAAAGWRIPQLHVWDLIGAARALPDPERWLPGYWDLGRPDVTAEVMNPRLRAFIAAALARA